MTPRHGIFGEFFARREVAEAVRDEQGSQAR